MTLRVLLSTPFSDIETKVKELEFYLRYGFDVTVDLGASSAELGEKIVDCLTQYGTSVRWTSLDPNASNSLAMEFRKLRSGFNVVVVSYPNFSFDVSNIQQILNEQDEYSSRLVAIAIANDSVSHLQDVIDFARESGLAIMSTSGVHAESAAEYTILQMGKSVRKLNFFSNSTSGLLQPNQSTSITRNLRSMTLSVIGASGRDGMATVQLARDLGMFVYASPSRDAEKNRQLEQMGAFVCRSDLEAIGKANLISVNVRVSEKTRGMVDLSYLSQLLPGTTMVSTTGCEVFDYASLVATLECNKPNKQLRNLVVDMPYVSSDGNMLSDFRNRKLLELGVEFTPRIAGYTRDSLLHASKQISKQLAGLPGERPLTSMPRYCRTLVEAEAVSATVSCVREAGQLAKSLRRQGLSCAYGAAGVFTNADLAVSNYLKDQLVEAGLGFGFAGEELGPIQDTQAKNWIIDGIDGTRNYRDGNYGWCISVALLSNGVTELGVVHDPVSDITYFGIRERGAFTIDRDGASPQPLRIPETLPADFSYSIGSFRVRQSRALKNMISDEIKQLGGHGREWGSVALSICAVARGGLGVFIQANSILHDHIAAVLIAREAGADVFEQKSQDAELVDVIASHPSLSTQVQQIVSSVCDHDVHP